MSELMNKINTADDYAVVQIVDFMYEELVDNYQQDIETLMATVSDDVTKVDGGTFADLFFSNEDFSMSSKDSPILARKVLLLCANEPSMRPLLDHALEHWKDDRQSPKIILSSGLVVALLMFTASTSFTIEADWGIIKKDAVSEKQLIAIANIIKEIAGLMKAGDKTDEREE